jgi:hypothetical protein
VRVGARIGARGATSGAAVGAPAARVGRLHQRQAPPRVRGHPRLHAPATAPVSPGDGALSHPASSSATSDQEKGGEDRGGEERKGGGRGGGGREGEIEKEGREKVC